MFEHHCTVICSVVYFLVHTCTEHHTEKAKNMTDTGSLQLQFHAVMASHKLDAEIWQCQKLVRQICEADLGG